VAEEQVVSLGQGMRNGQKGLRAGGIGRCLEADEREEASSGEEIAKARQHNLPIHPMKALTCCHQRIGRLKCNLFSGPAVNIENTPWFTCS
jgi:hypothetical protein